MSESSLSSFASFDDHDFGISWHDFSLCLQMAYVTYPRLELSGHCGGAEVSGSAWFDHQWGDLSWFVSGEKADGLKRLLGWGWDWFGSNLQCGMALVILVHRYGNQRYHRVQSGHYLGGRFD
jgi:predicted secreted hydrolase